MESKLLLNLAPYHILSQNISIISHNRYLLSYSHDVFDVIYVLSFFHGESSGLIQGERV